MANFKKVLAAVLSAAMVFTLAPVGATNVQAAAKASAGTTIKKLSVTKTTLKVGASKKVKVTISKKQAANLKVSLKSSKKAVATVASSVTIKKGKTAANFTIKAKKAGKTNVTVSFKAGNKTVKKTIKVTVKAVETNDDNVDVTDGKITLVDAWGLQSDGKTGLVGDNLRVEIPQTLGTMTQIIWYRDGNQIATSNAMGDANDTAGRGIDTTIAGEYYAMAITGKGTSYKSNSIKLTEDESAAVIKDFAIADDYTDGCDISYSATDANAVATVTLNKGYAGTIRFFKETDSKFKTNVTAINVAKDPTQTVKPTDFAVAGATANQAFTYRNTDGTFVIKVRTSFTRGTKYVVTFDQTSVGTDTPGSGTANKSDKVVEAPYVKAPASIAVTKVADGVKPEITFYDADKAVMGWLGNGARAAVAAVRGTTPAKAAVVANNAIGTLGIAELKVYSATSKTTTTTASGVTEITAMPTGATVSKGVYTGGTTANATAFWFATLKTEKGVFGADAVSLTSEPVQTAQASATNITVKQKKGTPTTAVVSLANLRTDGKVYIVKTRGTTGTAQTTIANCATVAYDAFDPNDSTTYVKAVDVTAGTLTVDVENSIGKPALADDTTDNNGANIVDETMENGYLAVFVPADETNYGKVYTNTAANNTGATWASNDDDPSTAGTNFFGVWVSQKLTTYALNGAFSDKVAYLRNAATGAAGSLTTASDDDVRLDPSKTAQYPTAAANILTFKDQFGDKIVHTNAAGEGHVWTFQNEGSEGFIGTIELTYASVGGEVIAATESATGTSDTIQVTNINRTSGAFANGNTFKANLATGQVLKLTYSVALDGFYLSLS